MLDSKLGIGLLSETRKLNLNPLTLTVESAFKERRLAQGRNYLLAL